MKKRTNGRVVLFALFLLWGICLRAQNKSIELSEVMFNPTDANSEFIELYNNSDSVTYDLAKLKIVYENSSPDLIKDSLNLILKPSNYAVVFEGDYDLKNGIYKNLLSENVLVCTIDNNSFGRSGMSNSSDRTLYLVYEEDTLETYTYSANNVKGVSDERIEHGFADWGNSLLTYGTPGKKNSISPKLYDLEISNALSEPGILVENQDFSIISKIKNFGEYDAEYFDLNIFIDTNKDSVALQSELIITESIAHLSASDSLFHSATLRGLSIGRYNLIIQIDFEPDELKTNNTFFLEIIISEKPLEYNSIVINEIMFVPKEEPEWIEIYNQSYKMINLKNWKLADSKSEIEITTKNYLLNPSEFLIITDDSSIVNYYSNNFNYLEVNLPSLNNSGDEIVIKDSLGFIMDSLYYKGNWLNNSGKSLEREEPFLSSLDSSSWKTSGDPNNATPGFINSVTPKEFDLAITNHRCENNFQFLGEPTKTFVTIKNISKNTCENFFVELYLDSNKDSIAQTNEFITSNNYSELEISDSLESEFTLTFFEEGNNRLISVIDFQNDLNNYNDTSFTSFIGIKLNEVRNDLIINEIMYDPDSSDTEWIEVYNGSNKIVNLKNYQIADSKDTSRVNDKDIFIDPDEYYVFAKDSMLLSRYGSIDNLIIGKFPSLNNSSDEVVILDSLNRVIDSVYYKDDWSSFENTSLERIDFDIISDSSNWKSYKYNRGGSPGNINSVTKKNYDLELTDILFYPENPFYGDTVFISAKIKNVGFKKSNFTVKLYQYSTYTNLLNESDIISLETGDSTIYLSTYTLENISEQKVFSIYIESATDQDLLNNKGYNKVIPGVPPNSVIVNEIMYYSDSDEPEWVEIYNQSERTINLRNWFISDVYNQTQQITVSKYDLLINPTEYLIISKDSSIVHFHETIEAKIHILNFANLNNDLDGIVIKDDRDIIIDSVIYDKSFNIKIGHSLERVDFDNSSTEKQNWSFSIDFEKSTPGRLNSVTPKNFDPTVVSLDFEPKYPTEGELVLPILTICNRGSKLINNLSVTFEVYNNNNYELLSDVNSISVDINDTLQVSSPNTFNIIDSALVRAKIYLNGDEDNFNNTISSVIFSGSDTNSIIVNEIMFNPTVDQPEWVEIINTSINPINLKDWFITDNSFNNLCKISETDLFLSSNEFLIISSDTLSQIASDIIISNRFPSLSSEDCIKIYDFRGSLIDSTCYSFNSIQKGLSIERYNCNDNTMWSYSLNENGSTAGTENSLNENFEVGFNDLIINEILFEADTLNSEFIEFYNQSEFEIELGVLDLIKRNGVKSKFSHGSFKLQPEKYYLLYADSSIFNSFPHLLDEEKMNLFSTSSFTLKNDSETMTINDIYGNTIDSVNYNKNWHNIHIEEVKNKSLERINVEHDSNNPKNWSTSVNEFGSTPLSANSIFIPERKTEKTISISPNPFSPDNDGFEDFSIISLNLEKPVTQIRAKVYDSKGRLVRNLIENTSVGPNSSFIFDGLNNNGTVLRIGIYILFIEAVGLDNNVIKTLKEPIVIARKL